MWNILNISSCYSGSRLNDPDREPFKDCRDPRLDFLLQMATMYKQMDCCFKGKGVKGLTGETANSLHQSLLGIVDLMSYQGNFRAT